MEDQKAVVSTVERGLQPLSPQDLVAPSRALRISPGRLLARLELALPSRVEQQIYLSVGGDFRILPESMAKILSRLRGEEHLTRKDFDPAGGGRGDRLLDAMAKVLELIEKDFDLKSYGLHPIAIENACVLVEYFGDHALNVLEDLICNIDQLRDFLPTKPERRASNSLLFETALYTLVAMLEEDEELDPVVYSPGGVVELLQNRFRNRDAGSCLMSMLSNRDEHDVLSRLWGHWPKEIRRLQGSDEDY